MNPAKYLRLMGNYEGKAPPSGVKCNFFPSFYIPAAKRLTHTIQLKKTGFGHFPFRSFRRTVVKIF